MKNKEQAIIDLFLQKKPSKIMLYLIRPKGPKYASVLAKEADCTYTHVLKILSELYEYGLVTFNKEGRIKRVRLTEKGAEVANELDGLVEKLKNAAKKEKKRGAKPKPAEEIEKTIDERIRRTSRKRLEEHLSQIIRRTEEA